MLTTLAYYYCAEDLHFSAFSNFIPGSQMGLFDTLPLVMLLLDVHSVCCINQFLQSYPELDLDDIMVISESERESKLKVCFY